jgi:molybdopterin synthase sulfur carrier subunit
MITVRVRYFASLRESLGPGETVSAAPGSTVLDLREALIARGSPYADVLARGRAVRCALDQLMCDERAVLADGAELAFFPPVTGG